MQSDWTSSAAGRYADVKIDGQVREFMCSPP